MNMRSLTFFGAVVSVLSLAAVSNLAACGNATSSGGSGGTGAGTGGGTGGGNGGGAACESTCAGATTNGGDVCAADTQPAADLSALQSCADTSCSTECSGQFPPPSGGLDSTCGGCLTTNCKTEQDTCNND
jgi:hypothetical protein